ncbi:ATP-binding protein [Segnochrobactraceae bacterium EtOH-i3]
MAVSIQNLRRVTADKPARILIYGDPGKGKTTLASEFPSPVFLQTEDGTPGGVELVSFGQLQTYRDVMQAIGELYEQPHDFRTVVIDSISAFQKMIFAEVCERGDEKGNRKKNIEDFGYGKGYVYAQRVVDEFVEALNILRTVRGMTIVLIAHSRVERFDDPESVSYDRYEIDLHAKLVGAIEREMDAILLVKSNVEVKTEEQGFNRERARGTGGAAIWIHTTGKPAYVAKNRYGMPEKFLFKTGEGYAALAPFLPKITQPAPVEAAA